MRKLMYTNDINKIREIRIETLKTKRETQVMELLLKCMQNPISCQIVIDDPIMKNDIDKLVEYIKEFDLDRYNSVISFMRMYGLNK